MDERYRGDLGIETTHLRRRACLGAEAAEGGDHLGMAAEGRAGGALGQHPRKKKRTIRFMSRYE
eukprot:5546-Amorphochlora_amoeboformis.AAC.1